MAQWNGIHSSWQDSLLDSFLLWPNKLFKMLSTRDWESGRKKAKHKKTSGNCNNWRQNNKWHWTLHYTTLQRQRIQNSRSAKWLAENKKKEIQLPRRSMVNTHMWLKGESLENRRKSFCMLLQVARTRASLTPTIPTRAHSDSASIRATKTQIVALLAASSSVCHTLPHRLLIQQPPSALRRVFLLSLPHHAYFLLFLFVFVVFLFYFDSNLQIFSQHFINHKSPAGKCAVNCSQI